ncbi:MAG: DMT family transporter, partial [Eubacteriales bacterium]
MWGSIGTFVTTLSALGFSSVQLVSVRILLTLVILFLYILFTDRKKFRIDPRDIWMFLGSGILSFVCFNLCYFTSIKLTGLCTAAILLYTSPVFVAIMSRIFFHEKLSANKLAALPMALLGCALVSGITSGGSFNTIGVLCGLACGFGYALYSIFGRVALKKYNSVTVTFYTFLCAMLGILPFSHITEIPALIKAPATALLLVGLAVVTNLLPYSLYT